MLQVMGAPAQAGQVSSEQTVIGQAESASEGFVLPSEALEVLPQSDQALLSLPQDELPSLDQAPQADAEQWLFNVLQQQQAQLQASEKLPVALALALALEAATQPLVERSAQVAVSTGDDQLMLEELPRKTVTLEWGSVVASSANQALQVQPAQASVSVPVAAGVGLEGGVSLTALAEGASLESVPAQVDVVRPSEASVAQLERSLKLQAPQAKWGEQMLGALREQVELQLQQRVQSTTIRLDPPELGSLEIFLSHESGRVNVQISAASTEVARLLQQTSERLRGELLAQNFVEVSVEVGQQQGDQSGRRQARWQLPDDTSVTANGVELAEQMATEARTSDVLITV